MGLLHASGRILTIRRSKSRPRETKCLRAGDSGREADRTTERTLFAAVDLFVSPKMGWNKDVREDDQKSECNVHEGKEPVREIIEDGYTDYTRNEREIPFDRLTGELPEVILPHGKGAFNPCRGFNRDETDSYQMADAE